MSIAPASSASAAASSPDWNSISAVVCCPLCEYELRGLIEPRCPECGYQFTWPEVLDADRRPHPYLFEHHPERNVWSFLKTKIAGFAPWRFWKTLKPTMAPQPRRLVGYWLIHVPLLLLLVVGGFVRFWISTAPGMRSARANMLFYTQRYPNDGLTKDRTNRYGSVQKAIDDQLPEPYTLAGFRSALNSFKAIRTNNGGSEYASTALLIFVWPWITFLTLMIFRVSMARAKVKPIHVVRCVIYSCDMFIIAIAWLVPIVPQFNQFNYDPIAAFNALVMSCLVLSGLTLYKLGFAYRLYLKFPHACATTIVAQLVVSLAIVSIGSAVLFW